MKAVNKSESKYFNTAVRMDEALMALLEKKDFEYISIKEICSEAGVNRSTFYLHYENMCELLDEAVALMHERFQSYFEHESKSFVKRLSSCSDEELLLITPEYLTPYLSFIRDHKRLYAAAMRKPADFRSDETYNKMFRHIFEPILARFSVPSEERAYIMAFYLNGITAVVSEWLRDDCKGSIEFVSGVIMRCIPGKNEIAGKL